MKHYFSLIFLALLLLSCGENQDNNSGSQQLSIKRGISSSEIFSIAQKMRLEFSAPLNTSTVNSSTVYLEKLASNEEETTEIVGSYTGVSAGTNKIYLTPYEYLKPSSQYQIVVTTGVEDVDGHSLSHQYIYPFTTDAEDVNSSSFGIRSLKPADSATDVIVNIDIVVDFNATLSAEAEYSGNHYFDVTYEDNDSVVHEISGNVEVFNSLLRFKPNVALPYDTNITVGLSEDMKNMYGTISAVAGTKWSFTTKTQESSPSSDGFYPMNRFQTDKKSSSLAKYGSKFVVARSGGIDMYEITYTNRVPNARKLSSFDIPPAITSMTMDMEYILISTINNGVYVLKYQTDGTVTLVENVLSDETIFSVKFSESNSSRIYAVGPEYGLEIFSFDSATDTIESEHHILPSVVKTALDVEEVESYDEEADAQVKKIYIADYLGSMIILDINGTLISQTDLNSSIKRFTFNEDYNGKMGIFAISSSGISQGLDFNGTIFSNVSTNLPGTISSVYSHVDPEGPSNLYYSNFEHGIIKTSGDYVDNIIFTGGSVVSSAYVNADSNMTAGFLVAVNEDGTVGFYNAMSDIQGPMYSGNDHPASDSLDANISLYLSDSYFDEEQISAENFKLYDLNVSSTEPIAMSFSKTMGGESVTITLNPDENVTDEHTYSISISSTFSDKFGHKFNDGVDQNISFVVE